MTHEIASGPGGPRSILQLKIGGGRRPPARLLTTSRRNFPGENA
jgi:hypothetical protein